MADVEVSVGFEPGGLSSMESQLNALMNKKYSLKLDTTEAQSKIKSLMSNLSGGSGGSIKTGSVKIDTSAAEQKLKSLGTTIEIMSAKATKMKLAGADTSELNKTIGVLKKIDAAYSQSSKSAADVASNYAKMQKALSAASLETQRIAAGSSLESAIGKVGNSINSARSRIERLKSSDLTGTNTSGLLKELDAVEARYERIQARLSQPDAFTNSSLRSSLLNQMSGVEADIDNIVQKASGIGEQFKQADKQITLNNAIGQLDEFISKLKDVEGAGKLVEQMRTFKDSLTGANGTELFSGNAKQLSAQIAEFKAQASEFPEFQIKFSADAAEKAMSSLSQKIEMYKSKSADLKLDGINTSTLDQYISSLESQNNAWETTRANVTSANTAYEQTKSILAGISAELSKLSAESSLLSSFESFGKSIDSVSTKVETLGKSDLTGSTTKGMADEIERIRASYSELMSDINSGKVSATSSEAATRFSELETKLDSVKEKVTETTRQFKEMDKAASVGNAVSQIDELLQKLKTSGSGFDGVKEKLQKSALQSGSFSGNMSKFNEQIRQAKQEIAELEQQANSGLGGAFKKVFGSITNTFKTLAITKAQQLLRQSMEQIYKNVVEIDKSMTQLKIVTGASDSQLTNFFERSAEAAQKFGASVTDVLDSVQTFSRLGYNLNDSLDLSSFATILSNTADVTVDQATTGLTSIIKGYNLDVSDAEHVSDVLINIGQKYAISAGELMEAFEKGGAALNATGTSFEASAGLFAAGNAAIQNASTVGTALKTVSARIRGAKTELIELGEETEDCATGLSKYRDELMSLTNVGEGGGVDLMANAATGEYKTIDQIFIEISKKWDQMSDTSQARVSEILGGTRQLSIISSIIGNIADAENAYTDAMNSNGVSQKANADVLDSIGGKMEQLSASWQVFSNDFLSSDLVKGTVDFLNTVVNLLDKTIGKIGALPTLIAAINIGRITKNFGITNVFALHGSDSMAA